MSKADKSHVSMTEEEMLEALKGKYDFKLHGAGVSTSTPKAKKSESFFVKLSSGDPHGFKPKIETSHGTSHTEHETTVIRSHSQVPKVPFFSGDEQPQKGDVTYEEWRFEIRCLVSDDEITNNMLIQSIRRSLKGTARKMLIPLGEKATVAEILHKLDTIFGDVSTKGMVMQEFFNSLQRPEESVTAFGCRLESLLQTAIDNEHIARESKNDLLRHKFWTSLHSERLKSQTRHKYDTVLSYEELLREIRMVDREISSTPIMPAKKAQQHAQAADCPSTQIEKLEKKITELGTRLDNKIDSKFDEILKRLGDRPAPTPPNQAHDQSHNNRGYQNGNYGGGGRGKQYRGQQNNRGYGNRGRGRSYHNNPGGSYNNNPGGPHPNDRQDRYDNNPKV